MLSIESTREPDSNWNDRLLTSKLGTIFHTKEYAMYTKNSLGWDYDFLKFVNQKGEIVGQLMMSIYSSFHNKSTLEKVLKKLTTNKLIHRWVYGPVVFDSDYDDAIRDSLCKYLITKNARVSGSEHPLQSGFFSNLEKPFIIKSWATFIIDLSLEKEILLKKTDKHSVRKNIERSQKRGVYVKEIDDFNLVQYHQMRKKTKNKLDKEFLESDTKLLWENMHQTGLTGFIAYENETPVGGIVVSFFNNYVNEWGIIRTEKDTTEKLYAQDLLKWKIIEWGINNKFHYYDLTGVDPTPENDKETQIFRYKKKFGGNLVKYNLVRL